MDLQQSLLDIWERIRVELSNFKYKYKLSPRILLLNIAYERDCKEIIEAKLSNDSPYFTHMQIMFSPKIFIDDFEVF